MLDLCALILALPLCRMSAPSPPAVTARNGLSGPAIPLSSLRGAQALPKPVVLTCPPGVQPHVRDPLRPLQIQQCM